MNKLPDAESKEGKVVRYGLVFLCAFIFNEIGDHVSAIFVSLTYYVDGASTLIGYVLSGLPFGWILFALFKEKTRSVVMVLPVFMLLASLLKSIYLFIDQERVFHITKWLSYMVSSGHGLRFVYIACGAYAAQILIKKYPALAVPVRAT